MRRRGTAVVFRDDCVLLVRDRGKRSYSLPGGGVNRNEPSISAAIRELYEELDMLANKAERRSECDFEGSFSKHEVSLIETSDEPVLVSAELSDFIWWDRKEEVPRYAHVDQVLRKLNS